MRGGGVPGPAAAPVTCHWPGCPCQVDAALEYVGQSRRMFPELCCALTTRTAAQRVLGHKEKYLEGLMHSGGGLGHKEKDLEGLMHTGGGLGLKGEYLEGLMHTGWAGGCMQVECRGACILHPPYPPPSHSPGLPTPPSPPGLLHPPPPRPAGGTREPKAGGLAAAPC